MGVVVRRYIDILKIIINFPYSTCIIALFLAAVYIQHVIRLAMHSFISVALSAIGGVRRVESVQSYFNDFKIPLPIKNMQ